MVIVDHLLRNATAHCSLVQYSTVIADTSFGVSTVIVIVTNVLAFIVGDMHSFSSLQLRFFVPVASPLFSTLADNSI